MEHDHSPAAIHARLSVDPKINYLRDWIYGGIDGAVTTFAIVAGVAGAELAPSVIVVLGAANIIADGFSMGAGNFSGTAAERDEYRRLEAIEREHIRLAPEGEREEVREIYRQKGFDGELLERVVGVVTAERERWVKTMMTEEYGLPRVVRSPWLAAVSTFSAFLICGMVPLLPYLLNTREPFAIATVLTCAVFFGIGSAKSRWSDRSWWFSGCETLLIGGAGAILAFAVGRLLGQTLG